MLGGEALVPRAIFVIAMAALGIAAAFVVLNHPDFFTANRSQPAARHHTLDSPYSGQRFRQGQPQGQTNTAVGRAFPSSLAAAYKAAGYEWLAVTDLNTLTPPERYTAPGLVAVQGVDVAYPYAHFMAIGADRLEAATAPQVAVDWIHNDAAAAFIARPLQPPALDYPTIATLKGLDGIQIFDARLVKEDPNHADATQLWDRLLTDHHILWGIVGDDTADDKGLASTLGKTSVDVQVDDLSPPLVEDALRRGAFVDTAGVRILSVSTTTDTVTVVTANADNVQFIGGGGTVRKSVSGSRGDYKVDWSEGYIRVLATNQGGGRAWTQPIVVNP